MYLVRRLGKSLKEILYGDQIVTYYQSSLLKKARGYAVGTIREWSGKKYKKGNNGKWFPVGGENPQRKEGKTSPKGSGRTFHKEERDDAMEGGFDDLLKYRVVEEAVDKEYKKQMSGSKDSKERKDLKESHEQGFFAEGLLDDEDFIDRAFTY